MPLRERLSREDVEAVAVDVLGQISTLAARIDEYQRDLDLAVDDRDKLIYQLSLINVPNHRIAKATGLSHGRVSQIVKMQTEIAKAREVAATLQDLKEDLSAAPRPEQR